MIITALFWMMVRISGRFPANRAAAPKYQSPRKPMWKSTRNRTEARNKVKNRDRFIRMSTPMDWKLGRWYTAAIKSHPTYLQAIQFNDVRLTPRTRLFDYLYTKTIRELYLLEPIKPWSHQQNLLRKSQCHHVDWEENILHNEAKNQ